MLYSTFLLAATAFSGAVVAQNSSSPVEGLPTSIEPCCKVDSDLVPDDKKTAWCRAQTNSCPEICGGQGAVASGGNSCDLDTLDFQCKCRNGTTPVMANYEQSVPGQMCRFWYGRCINATGTDATQQYACDQTRNLQCGNLTTKGEDPNESSSSSTGTSRPTSTSSDSNSDASNTADPTGAAQTGSSTPGAAARLARDFGAPVVAGGLIAFFGIAL